MINIDNIDFSRGKARLQELIDRKPIRLSTRFDDSIIVEADPDADIEFVITTDNEITNFSGRIK